MGDLVIALIPLLQGLLAGSGGVSAALDAVTFAQWVTIGAKALEAGPAVMAAIPKAMASIHPLLAALQPALEQFMADLDLGDNPRDAAATMRARLAANAAAAIHLQPGD